MSITNDTLSGVIDDLESDIEGLGDARHEDVDEASETLDRIAYSLRERADELEAISSKLADARNVLS